MKVVVLIIIISLGLAGCSSSEVSPLNTQEYFTSRVNELGKTQFAFGLSWQMGDDFIRDRNAPRERQQDNIERRLHRPGDKALQDNHLDKQSKLQLEDQAAAKLQTQIDKRKLCENGHRVEQVVWEVGRIRLMGHCL